MKNKINKLINNSKNLSLLYIEDDKNAREITLIILKEFISNITIAVDGEDGYNKFCNENFDLIITDINMPKLNGLELIEKIREKNQEIPILVLSAHNDNNFFIQSIKLGVDGYLIKPIDLEQLQQALLKVVTKIKYKKESDENIHLLKEYQEITNEASIVSKTDLKGHITYVNDAFCDISGFSRKELIGKNHNIVRHPDMPEYIFENIWDTIQNKKNIWKGIVRNRNKKGKSYYVYSVIKPILDINGVVQEYISLRNDITYVMNPVKQLSDAIKNTPNPLLIYFKLDRYEMVEEFYDNSMVQKIQNKIVKYIEEKFSSLYNFDLVYNLDNGEYAILINKENYYQDKNSFVKSLKKYQDFIRNDKVQIENIEYNISLLISFATVNDKILESVKLGMKKLLKTKQDFILANNLAQKVKEKAQKNMNTISMIQEAINSHKIISYFQPIIDNTTKKVVKYESLVRLIDKDDKILSPFFFLEIAKKSDQYMKITNIVLEHSFEILKNCSFDISINLSALDIEQKSTRNKIFSLLKKHKQHTSRIVFELLEDESINDFELVKQFISDVKNQYSVKIAIDDFGAGYSNYERLLSYQPDILKIDGSLIKDIVTNSYSRSIVKSIVIFAKEQKLQTIAEFIENKDIYETIKELGIDYSQGYYFGRPSPFGDEK